MRTSHVRCNLILPPQNNFPLKSQFTTLPTKRVLKYYSVVITLASNTPEGKDSRCHDQRQSFRCIPSEKASFGNSTLRASRWTDGKPGKPLLFLPLFSLTAAKDGREKSNEKKAKRKQSDQCNERNTWTSLRFDETEEFAATFMNINTIKATCMRKE